MEVNQEIISHRLFIGGLFDKITAKEIRDRFASFGQIGNIQIVQRKDDNGEVMKTFCYMDISASLSKINKCISLYSKSKWKGNEIKVQIAKESYLTRLEREWTSRNSNEVTNENIATTPSKDYKEITEKVSKMKAIVPGTRISDEPNWTIGKYGRPLPIVRLLHKNSKVIKFDPSKHCHQLKKLVAVGDEAGDCLANLSWSLDETDEKRDAGEERRKKKRRKIELSDCIGKENPDVEKKVGSPSNGITDSFDLKNGSVMNSEIYLSTENDEDLNSNENTVKGKKVGVRRLPKIGFNDILHDITSNSSKDVSIGDIVIGSDGITESIGSSDELEFSQAAMKNELKEETRNEACHLGESIVSQITRKISKPCSGDRGVSFDSDLGNNLLKENSRNVYMENGTSDSEDGDLSEDRGLRSTSEESTLESTGSDEGEYEEIYNENNKIGHRISVDRRESSHIEETSSENGSDTLDKPRSSRNDINVIDNESNANQPDVLSNEDSSSEDSEVSLHRQHCVNDTGTMNEDIQAEETERLLSNIKKKSAQSRVEIYNNKKKLSEEKRLHSLNERKKAELSQRQLVSLALKSETSGSKDSQHIQFGSSDEDLDDTCNFGDEVANKKKVTGTAALSWLGLDDSGDADDRDDDENDDSKRFEIKKQFEGLKGAELFKLHKKAALDERFKVDERFLESESEVENNGTYEGDAQVDNDIELGVEKSRALSILDDLLGKKSKAVQKNTGTKEKIINDFIRYDPLDEMHAEYENVEECNESEAEAIELSANQQKASDKAYPEVAKETYYNVSGDLKGLFGKSETNAFSFLNGDESSNMKTVPTVFDEAKSLEEKKYDTSFHKFDDESGDEECSVGDISTKIEAGSEISARSLDTLFFFTEDDPRFKSSAIGCPSDFMRKESTEELYRQLEANRERLRQDFKRKHKDAIRRQKKKESVKSKVQLEFS